MYLDLGKSAGLNIWRSPKIFDALDVSDESDLGL